MFNTGVAPLACVTELAYTVQKALGMLLNSRINSDTSAMLFMAFFYIECTT